ncbi:MAG TPA: mannose-1-phosphate guanylyltransferase [Polyangiales bacterium]
MDEVFAVIMAGGSGTRFWPLSRSAWPKQFLALAGSSDSLLQQTVRRLTGVVPADHVLVVTSERHAQATREQLPELPAQNVLGEPEGRNTAPCVAWAAAHVAARSPTAVMAVLPADPHIGDPKAYREVLGRAIAAARKGGLVTIGVTPTRPETGYGYVEIGEALDGSVHRVKRFVEKPDLNRAQQFVADGNFLWNSGMFFFRADVVLGEFERQLPDIHEFARGCQQQLAAGSELAYVRSRYGSLTSISIDHGIMEKARDIRVVPGSFGWYDIGSWTTAYELADKDAQNNAVLGDASLVETEGCYVRGKAGKLIALVGVHDLVVVDTDDALLIMPRERAQDVRRVVDDLKAKKATKYL